MSTARRTSNPFVSNLMGWTLLREVRHHPEFRRCGIAYWQIYRRFLHHLLADVSDRACGRLVIWLPEHLVTPEALGARTRRPAADTPEGAVLFESLHQAGNERQVAAHARRLLRLARVGGALILSSRLRPLACGPAPEAGPWGGRTIHGLDAESCEPCPVDLAAYDAHHVMAVNFVAAHPGAIGFVISRDRAVVGVTRQDAQTVYWCPNCLGG